MRDKFRITKHRGHYEAVEIKTGRTYRRPLSKPGEWIEVVDWPAKVEKLEAAVTAHETPDGFACPTIGPRPPVAVELRQLSAYARRNPRGEGNRYE